MFSDLRSVLEAKGMITFSVRVRPQAAKTCFKKPLANGTFKIDLAAVPEDGEANAELVRFLAEAFGVERSAVEIASGKTSRMKTVRITL